MVPKAADGIALFTFDELCEQALGPADYLKICQIYQTIVIQSIPQMGLLEKDEARRLITFIDAAYENKVKLLISADVNPDRLFLITDDEDVETKDQFMHKVR
jgi:predicted ATPase